MLLRDYKWLTALVLILSGAMASAAWFIWHEPVIDPSQRPVASWRPSITAPEIQGHAAATATLDQALSRPVFRPSRRPFDPAAPPAIDPQIPVEQPIVELAPPAPLPPQVTLRGVYLNGATHKALIGTTESAESLWMNEGASIAGWTLMEITPEKIILSSAGQKTEIKLYVDNVQQSLSSP